MREKRHMYYTKFVWCLVFPACFCTNSFATDLTEIKQVWKEQAQLLDDVELSLVINATISGPQSAKQKENCVIRRIKFNESLRINDQLVVKNEKYTFNAKTKDSDWVLGTYGLNSEDKIRPSINKLSSAMENMHFQHTVGDVLLIDHIDKLKIVDETDRMITAISTSDIKSEGSANSITLFNLEIKMDKKYHFFIAEAKSNQHINTSRGKTSTKRLIFDRVGNEQKFSETTTDSYGLPPDGLVIEKVIDYKYTYRVGLKNSDFRLSAYGLPEPEGVVWEKPTPTYIWFLLGAGAFGVFALLFGYLKRRSSRESLAPRPA